MTIEEMVAAISEMPTGDAKEFLSALGKNEKGGAILSSFVDQKVNAAVRSHDLKLKESGKLGNPDDMVKRLDKIEQAYNTKAERLAHIIGVSKLSAFLQLQVVRADGRVYLLIDER